ncbi:MAG: hypothetical protein ACRC31_04710 [Cetobacterium sp.]
MVKVSIIINVYWIGGMFSYNKHLKEFDAISFNDIKEEAINRVGEWLSRKEIINIRIGILPNKE